MMHMKRYCLRAIMTIPAQASSAANVMRFPLSTSAVIRLTQLEITIMSWRIDVPEVICVMQISAATAAKIAVRVGSRNVSSKL